MKRNILFAIVPFVMALIIGGPTQTNNLFGQQATVDELQKIKEGYGIYENMPVGSGQDVGTVDLEHHKKQKSYKVIKRWERKIKKGTLKFKHFFRERRDFPVWKEIITYKLDVDGRTDDLTVPRDENVWLTIRKSIVEVPETITTMNKKEVKEVYKAIRTPGREEKWEKGEFIRKFE